MSLRRAHGVSMNRELDGLLGNVESVRTERARIFRRRGAWVEDKPVPVSTDFYDERGALTGGSARSLNDLGLLIMRNPDSTSLLPPSEPASDFLRAVLAYLPGEESTSDEEGNVIERRYFNPDGTISTKAAYKYDERGNVIEESMSGESLLITRQQHAFEYDSTGNWVKRVSSTYVCKMGKSYFKPYEAIYRTITYY